jgi:DNA mismatch endonuclease (patch repair protein)
MARVRSSNTNPEIELRRALWKAGFRYRLRLRLPGSPDVVFLHARLAVFVDGCFWHGCPVHYTKPVRNAVFWREKLKHNVRRDRAADQALAGLGWSVLRLWEHEVTQDLEGAVRKVVDALVENRV